MQAIIPYVFSAVFLAAIPLAWAYGRRLGRLEAAASARAEFRDAQSSAEDEAEQRRFSDAVASLMSYGQELGMPDFSAAEVRK
ncbi:MAG: hypothetical protein LBT36_00390 [Oscillospiraceae bacterium]|jgi:hypothetical protein|nr:hypothetical protein [Oscillospiraceae bacterium]